MAKSKAPRPEPDDTEGTDASVRKKKKAKKKQALRWPLYASIAGVGVFVLVLIGVAIWGLVQFAGGRAAKPVTAWEKHTTEESEFGFEYPAGWGLKSYGIRGKREVEVKESGASISVKENLAGSLVGDIAGAIGGGLADDDRSPVAQVHAMRKPQDSSSYQEGTAVTVTTRFGKARMSPYKDGYKRGYRATILMHQTALDVFCECRAADWDTLRPAFEHVIESLGPGRP